MASILIMEDEPEIALWISRTLSECGHDADITRTGSEALTTLHETHYDLLITDIYVRAGGMPIPDGGIKLIGHVRQCGQGPNQDWLRQMPILAVSGAARSIGQVDLFSLAKSIGANAALAKPLDVDTFKEVVQDLLVPE